MEWQDEISFNGNGYIDLNKKLISHKVDMNWELKIDLSTWINEGLILWQGASSDSVFSSERNDIAVGIAQGKIQFWSNNKPLTVEGKMVNDGQEHKISVKKDGIKIILDVDGMQASDDFPNLEDEELMEKLQEMDVFLGGLPDGMFENYFLSGFTGCIHYLDAYNKPKPGINKPSYGARVNFADSVMNQESEGVESTKQCLLGKICGYSYNIRQKFNFNTKFH